MNYYCYITDPSQKYLCVHNNFKYLFPNTMKLCDIKAN